MLNALIGGAKVGLAIGGGVVGAGGLILGGLVIAELSGVYDFLDDRSEKRHNKRMDAYDKRSDKRLKKVGKAKTSRK